MAILPGAIVKIVTRHTTPRVGQRGFCLHIAVSDGASLFNYFNQSGNPTSHGYVRKTGSTPAVAVGTPLSPVMADFEQYVDTKYQAPANLEGNPTLISWETQGGVGDDLNNGWTPAQLERIAWILAQCNKIHGMPLTAMPNSLPASTGVGYHRLGVDPWRVDGGELWSNSYGKVCPGSARIAQIPQIINRARQIAAEGEWNMATADEVLAEVVAFRTEERYRYARYEAIHTATLNALKAQQAALLAAQEAEDVTDDIQVTALQASLDELEAAVAAQQVAEAGRYGHIIDTLTVWAETKDNIRQDELLAKLAELHPPAPPPLA